MNKNLDNHQGTVIKRVTDWIKQTESPEGKNRAYHKCPICGGSWWPGDALRAEGNAHSRACWIPVFKHVFFEDKMEVDDDG